MLSDKRKSKGRWVTGGDLKRSLIWTMNIFSILLSFLLILLVGFLEVPRSHCLSIVYYLIKYFTWIVQPTILLEIFLRMLLSLLIKHWQFFLYILIRKSKYRLFTCLSYCFVHFLLILSHFFTSFCQPPRDYQLLSPVSLPVTPCLPPCLYILCAVHIVYNFTRD